MQKTWTNLGFALGLICLIAGAFGVSRAVGFLVAGVILIVMSVAHYQKDKKPMGGEDA